MYSGNNDPIIVIVVVAGSHQPLIMLVSTTLVVVVLVFIFCSNVAAEANPIRRLRRHDLPLTQPRALQTRQTTYMRKPCLTELSCKERFTALYNAGVITGYFYNVPNPNTSTSSSKGCILKGDNVMFTIGTEDEIMMAPLTGTKKVRLWCVDEITTDDDDDNNIIQEMSMISSMSITDNIMPMSMPAEMSLSMSMSKSSANSRSMTSMSMTSMSISISLSMSEGEELISMSMISMSMTEMSTSGVTLAEMSLSMPDELIPNPNKISGLEEETSMSSRFIVPAEVSLSMSTPSTFIVPAAMSLSMHKEEILSMPTRFIVPAEMSLSLSVTEVEVSMPSRFIVPAEMSLSLSMPEERISTPIRFFVPAELSLSMSEVEVSMPSRFIVPAEMSSSISYEEVSMPIVISEISLSMPDVSMISMPLELNEMCMSNMNPEISMPLQLSDMSMSMVLVPTIEQNDISISTDDRDSNTVDPSWQTPFVVFGGNLGRGDDIDDDDAESINSSRAPWSQIQIFTLLVVTTSMVMIGGYR